MDPKSSETFLDKLKSTKRWAAVIAAIIPLIASMISKEVDLATGITLSVLAILTGLGVIGAEDVSKHLRDGRVAEAAARKEVAKMATGAARDPQ